MHHADLLPSVFALRLRGERQAGLLGHGKRVDVRAQRHQRPRIAALDHGHEAGMGDSGLRFQAHVSQRFGNSGGCVELTVTQFRVGMEPAAPFDDLRLGVGGKLVETIGGDFGACEGGEEKKDGYEFFHRVLQNL